MQLMSCVAKGNPGNILSTIFHLPYSTRSLAALHCPHFTTISQCAMTKWQEIYPYQINPSRNGNVDCTIIIINFPYSSAVFLNKGLIRITFVILLEGISLEGTG